jgi:hypothetical protein
VNKPNCVFPPSRVAFLIVSGLLGLLGLYTLAAARDIGLTLFGSGLMVFGYAFGLSLIKRGFDEAEQGMR